MNELLADTPRYVLLDGKQRIGPKLSPLHEGRKCVAVYGFSDKQPYDRFCAESQLDLTPYPLVKGYLRDQLAVPGSTTHLVVVDAAGPNDARLHAATMASVLEAQEHQASQVAISFRLILDQESQDYRVQQESLDVDATNRHVTTSTSLRSES